MKGGSHMRKYRLFNKPAKVSDIIQEDLNSDISSSWEDRAEALQARRWRRIRQVQLRRPSFTRKSRRSGALHGNFGHMLS